MFIENAHQIKKDVWRYVLGVFLMAVVASLTGLFFQIALIAEVGVDQLIQMPTKDWFGILDANLSLFYILLPFSFCFFLIFGVARWLHDQSPRTLITSRTQIDWNRIFYSFGLISIVAICLTVISYWISPEDFIWNFKPNRFLILLLISILMLPLQTTVEELFFRGYLMQCFGFWSKNKGVALVITSLLFGLLHLQNPEIEELGTLIIIVYILTGFFLGIITLMDDGLELAIGFHAGNNLMTALLLTSDWTVLQTDSIFIDVSEPLIMVHLLPPFIMYPIFIIVFSKKYGWNHWKEKLFGSLIHESNA